MKVIDAIILIIRPIFRNRASFPGFFLNPHALSGRHHEA